MLPGVTIVPGKALRLKQLHPSAVDWIDAGRQEIRRRIEAHVSCARGNSANRYAFPVHTGAAMNLARSLGYDASRSYLDYFIRHGRMQLPPKNGRFLAWGIENVIDFAMQLERMRYWRIGHHDRKKTAWELESERRLDDVDYATADDHEVQEVDIDGMLDTVIDPGSVERCAEPANSFADRFDTSDAAVEALLGQTIEEPPTSQRKALGVVPDGDQRSILRRHRRTGGGLP